MPRGIRRGEPEHPEPKTVIGDRTVLEPLVVEHAVPSGTSNLANEQSAGQRYEDTAANLSRPGEAKATAPVPLKLR
jgi:hypothetical protein